MSDRPDGDWYCRKCGYLSWQRVTYHETCDTCHQPVEWHTKDDQTEIARLTEENKRLREDLDRVTSGTWSKELARLSSVNARLTAKDKRLRAVVDAARRYVGGGEYHERLEARNDLEDALRALDGEPCPTCGGTGRKP